MYAVTTTPQQSLVAHARGNAFGYPAAAVLLLLLLPFFYAAFFTYPAGDDFARSLKAGHIFDVFGGVHEMGRAWWKWSGRYTHHFLVVFLGDAANSRATYTAMTLGLFLFFWLCFYGIFKELGGKNSRPQAFFFATFGLAALLCSYNALNMWYLITNQLAVGAGQGMTLLYIWSLLALWNAPVVTRRIKFFCIASCIIAIGCYEYSAPLVFLCSLTAWAMAVLYRHPHRKHFNLLLKLSLLFFLISYLARGNFRRRSKRGMTDDMIGEQLADIPHVLAEYLAPTFLNPLFPLLVLGVIAFIPGWKTSLAKVIALPAVMTTGALCIAGFSCMQVVIHAMSDQPVTVGSNVPETLVQYSAIIAAFCLFTMSGKKPLPPLMKAAVFLAMLFFLVTTPNFRITLGNALSGKFLLLEAEMDARDKVMAGHAGEKLTIAPLQTFPYPARVNDPVGSGGFDSWPNKYAAKFYGLDKVNAAPPPDARAAWNDFLAGDPQPLWVSVGNGVSAAFFPRDAANATGATDSASWVFIKGMPQGTSTLHMAAIPRNAPLLALNDIRGKETDIVLPWTSSAKTLQYFSPGPDDSDRSMQGELLAAAPVTCAPQTADAVLALLYLSLDNRTFVNILEKPFP